MNRPALSRAARHSLTAALAATVWFLGAATLPAEERPGTPATEAPPRAVLTDAADLLPETTDADTLRYREHVITLANPFFEGRFSGTRKNELAAEYVEFYFRRSGLSPAFDGESAGTDGETAATPNATFRQTFDAGRETAVSRQVVTLKGGGEHATPLTPGVEFNVLGISGSGVAEGPMTFVGYSLEQTENGYATYAEGDDLKGQIVMLLRFEPMDDAGHSRFVPADKARDDGPWSPAASITPKLTAAAKRGAAAIILVGPPGADDPRATELETTAGSARFGRQLAIPAITMTQAAADRLLKGRDGKGPSLLELRRDADEHGSVRTIAGADLSIDVAAERRPRKTANVGAVLPGRGGLASEYIIIGGHFDHVGDGAEGGRKRSERGLIHPGADDNASGASGVLLAASRLAAVYHDLPEGASVRSIMFLAFSGEELGLYGSKSFVKASPIKAADTYAMLNMDMIGRLRDDKLEINGTGTADGLLQIVSPLFAESGLDITVLPGGRGPSDHASFYAAGVPVLFFFTGLHPEYHTAADVSDLINFEGAADVVDLTCRCALRLAARHEPLLFTSTDRKPTGGAPPVPPADDTGRPHPPAASDPHAAAPTPADEVARAHAALPAAPDRNGDDDAAGPSIGRMKIRFGIAPGSYAEDETGVLVGEVFPGTSAGEAGVKTGDRLMKWDGQEITDVAGWMTMMARHKPGDEVEVTVKRDGKELPLKVRLKAREQADR